MPILVREINGINIFKELDEKIMDNSKGLNDNLMQVEDKLGTG